MKKLKRGCRIVIIFMLLMSVSIVPTLLFRTKDEISSLFRQPAYWVITLSFAVFVTWQVVTAIEKNEK